MLSMSAPLAISGGSRPAISAETGNPATEAGRSGAELVDDRWVRAVGIPVFGGGIPRITGLFDGVAIGSPSYWIGSLAFVALAAAIWQGNRWLLFEQRRHWGWFDHPVRKVVMLLAAIVLFTAPLAITTLVAWYAARRVAPDVAAIRTVVLMIVVCVVFM